MGGPDTVPTFPNSPVPRANITVMSVQQFLSRTPFSVPPRPPELPCGEQSLPIVPELLGAFSVDLVGAAVSSARVGVAVTWINVVSLGLAGPFPAPLLPPDNRSLKPDPKPPLNRSAQLGLDPLPISGGPVADGSLASMSLRTPEPEPGLPVGREKDGKLKGRLNCGWGTAFAIPAMASKIPGFCLILWLEPNVKRTKASRPKMGTG